MGYWSYVTTGNDLVGKTFTSVRTERVNYNDGFIFEGPEGKYALYHQSDCCEHVYVEDVCGDFGDLVDTPILLCEIVSNSNLPPPPDVCEYGEPESYTWTFIKFATVKGHVTIRFFGSSNGYYSETADFYEWKETE